MSKVICVFGDSITWGAWDLEMGGWVNRLRIHFDNSDEETEIYNCGVDGDYVADVLKRFDPEAEARKPDVILLAIGINDSPHNSNPNGTDLNEFEKQYRQLLQKAKKFTEKLILIGLTNVEDEKTSGYQNESVEKYNYVVKKIALNQNLPFVDVFGSISNDELADGLHPNSKGHQKIFKKVKEILKI